MIFQGCTCLRSALPLARARSAPTKQCTNRANGAPIRQLNAVCFVEGVSKLNQCGLRSALPLARARKPNNHIAQGSALSIMVYIMNNAPCKGNTLIIRRLPFQGECRCGV